MSRTRPTTSMRGYGSAHEALRRRLEPFVASGACRCARCGRLIRPGENWDLGHRDGSGKTAYGGPEHANCNRRAGAEQTNAKRGRKTAHDYANDPAYQDDAENGVFWGAPDDGTNGLPRRWSRAWSKWR
jgi:hypothetical protein